MSKLVPVVTIPILGNSLAFKNLSFDQNISTMYGSASTTHGKSLYLNITKDMSGQVQEHGWSGHKGNIHLGAKASGK